MKIPMELEYQFPNKEARNNFLQLIAMNVGQFGYGFGLEFEGLEYALERPDARGDLISHVAPRAKGEWRLTRTGVVLDMAFIAATRDNFEKLRAKLADIAAQFGG
jgi:hypothetical protein